MHELSDRLLAAGWILEPVPGSQAWSLQGPDGFSGTWVQGQWSPSLEKLLNALERAEHGIRRNEQTPFRSTCRIWKPESLLLPAWTADAGFAADRDILRIQCRRDPAGDTRLLEHGARRVQTLFPWEIGTMEAKGAFHLVLIDHVTDLLPRIDRETMYATAKQHLRKDGQVFISLFDVSAVPPDVNRTPYEDGYRLQMGRHHCFLKPHTESGVLKELKREAGGKAEVVGHPYQEYICRWWPYA